MEVKKQKEEDKITKQLAVNKEDTATEVLTILPALLIFLVFMQLNLRSLIFNFSFVSAGRKQSFRSRWKAS